MSDVSGWGADGSARGRGPDGLGLEQHSEAELADLARSVVDQLAGRGTVDAFHSLVELSGYLGVALGESARRLAEHGSWSQVAEITGTSKQAAWSRWH